MLFIYFKSTFFLKYFNKPLSLAKKARTHPMLSLAEHTSLKSLILKEALEVSS